MEFKRVSTNDAHLNSNGIGNREWYFDKCLRESSHYDADTSEVATKCQVTSTCDSHNDFSVMFDCRSYRFKLKHKPLK